MDNGTLNSILLLQGITAGTLFVVFRHLYEQGRERYAYAWQLTWGFYCIHCFLQAWNQAPTNTLSVWLAKSALAMTAVCLYVSAYLVRRDNGNRWLNAALIAAGLLWSAITARATMLGTQRSSYWFDLGITHPTGLHIPLSVDIGIAALLLFTAYSFAQQSVQHRSMPLALLSTSLGLWPFLLIVQYYPNFLEQLLGEYGHLLDPVPQVLLSLAMVMVLYESERRAVQENLLAFSSLQLTHERIVDADDLHPAMGRMLHRVLDALRVHRGALWIGDWWRSLLPSAQQGFSEGFLNSLYNDGSGDVLTELATNNNGRLVLKSLNVLSPEEGPDERTLLLQQALEQENVRGLTVVSLRTRESNFGLLILPHAGRRGFGASQMRLLSAMVRQMSMTLENYALMQEATRRTEEYELLTQIGQVVSSRLDPDEVLRTVQRELGRLFDTRTFYIAFVENDEVTFELEMSEGTVLPKRSRRATKGITEYIVETGEPLLVRANMETFRERIGLVATGGRLAKCFCGVPIFMYGRAVGVMATLSHEREFVYEQRDLDVMKTAAGQVAVAMENARLFAEEQRRARYLEFLNSVSKTAISSQEPDAMMAEIVGAIQNNFRFDHIGIGILDYATKDIEIKAEAGTTEKMLGRRIPLGVGILGRAARTNEMALVQNTLEGRLLGIVPESKSILCIPIAYGETLLGVLNVESRRENAFAQQEVLILRTLADLLATALHNSFVFQKMQQQSITDGLTGIKTRRFFNEALASEWKRASRSGRPFSVVLIDLDKFKGVNDNMGHLEGDLVLARIGRILEQKSRSSNVVARYGGDEFVVLMPETGVEQAQILSERLRLWIATDTMLNERQITGSFGVATFPIHGATAEDVLRVADMGMYTSKRAGGNRVSTPEDFGQGEGLVSQKQLVTAYIESFLQREEIGPSAVNELIAILGKLNDSIRDGSNADALLEAVRMLNHAAEAREVSGGGHGDVVAEYAEIIGRELGLPPDELLDLKLAARVHDVGKILVGEHILNQAGPLSEEELRRIRMHPHLGALILETIPGASRIATFVRHHHERFDGTGYPEKLSGEQIPLGARIIAVAEAYAHITSERPYAAKKTPSQAKAELEQLSGTQFDGMVVRMFLRQIKTPKGPKVARSEA